MCTISNYIAGTDSGARHAKMAGHVKQEVQVG